MCLLRQPILVTARSSQRCLRVRRPQHRCTRTPMITSVPLVWMVQAVAQPSTIQSRRVVWAQDRLHLSFLDDLFRSRVQPNDRQGRWRAGVVLLLLAVWNTALRKSKDSSPAQLHTISSQPDYATRRHTWRLSKQPHHSRAFARPFISLHTVTFASFFAASGRSATSQ